MIWWESLLAYFGTLPVLAQCIIALAWMSIHLLIFDILKDIFRGVEEKYLINDWGDDCPRFRVRDKEYT